jgi:hypothetical protein
MNPRDDTLNTRLPAAKALTPSQPNLRPLNSEYSVGSSSSQITLVVPARDLPISAEDATGSMPNAEALPHRRVASSSDISMAAASDDLSVTAASDIEGGHFFPNAFWR